MGKRGSKGQNQTLSKRIKKYKNPTNYIQETFELRGEKHTLEALKQPERERERQRHTREGGSNEQSERDDEDSDLQPDPARCTCSL